MSSQLTEEELAALMPSELVPYRTPIPTQIVSSDEFYPDPQNEQQREVEARLLAMADELGGKQGIGDRPLLPDTLVIGPNRMKLKKWADRAEVLAVFPPVLEPDHLRYVVGDGAVVGDNQCLSRLDRGFSRAVRGVVVFSPIEAFERRVRAAEPRKGERRIKEQPFDRHRWNLRIDKFR